MQLESKGHILVTGGAGYIGSHACKALARRGWTPVTYDNLSRGNRWAVKWGPLEQGNIADRDRLRAVLKQYRPMALMHFAAFAYVDESVRQPLLYYQNNCAATATLLQALIELSPIPVVFSSSCASYGVPEQTPMSEDHPQRPINPYGYSKLFVEQMLSDLNRSQGLPWIALRYFNAGGADPDGEIGEAHTPETHLIPLVIESALTGSRVKVFGDDYETADGTCVRDYVHVSDIADAHVRALEYLLATGESRALNLANARGYSVREVITAVARACGTPVRFEIAPRRPGDPPILIGDATLARAALGWQPARSTLEIQIRDALNWVKSRR